MRKQKWRLCRDFEILQSLLFPLEKTFDEMIIEDASITALNGGIVLAIDRVNQAQSSGIPKPIRAAVFIEIRDHELRLVFDFGSKVIQPVGTNQEQKLSGVISVESKVGILIPFPNEKNIVPAVLLSSYAIYL